MIYWNILLAGYAHADFIMLKAPLSDDDGILIDAHSLFINEFSMTRESNIDQKDHNTPFFMSACKVIDCYSNMLAAGVRIHMEWGFLTATISRDYGNKTLLPVWWIGVAISIDRVGILVTLAIIFALQTRFVLRPITTPNGIVPFQLRYLGAEAAFNGDKKRFHQS